MNNQIKKYFYGRKLVIATMHGKEQILKNLLKRKLWVEIILPDWLDTDAFWTFTWEKQRDGDQLEAARKKLLKALKLTGESLWVATEWTFWPDANIPFLSSHRELMILIDTKNNLEIIWHSQSFDTNLAWEVVEKEDEIKDFLKKIGFPKHGVIIRKKAWDNKNIIKDVSSIDGVLQEVSKLQQKSFFSKKVYLETDMRAMKNPTRMKYIELACENLIEKLSSSCPKCWTPWFSITDIVPWLPCEWCKSPTSLPLSEIHSCKSCWHSETHQSKKYGKYSPAGNCLNCNP